MRVLRASRLIGERVRVHLFDQRIEVYYADKLELACDRLRNGATRIDDRHVIWSLVRKPGAFARYVYREGLFPSVTFRRAYDAICAACSAGRLDKGAVSASTVRRLFAEGGLDRIPLRDGTGAKTRLRWQAERPGALWQGDVCYGPAISLGGTSKPAHPRAARRRLPVCHRARGASHRT